MRYVVDAHLANWFWKEAGERRYRREQAFCRRKLDLLQDYIPLAKTLKPETENAVALTETPSEPIFMFWQQGEAEEPPIVRKCIAEARRIYGEKLVFLCGKNLYDYIRLPDYVMEKWNLGQMIPAHFADIVRLELLYRYGGFWMDATLFPTGPVKKEIEEADFFMYVTGRNKTSQMMVHNCFIRARKGNQLLSLWRQLVMEYWRREEKAKAYYLVHFLFQLLIRHNSLAAAEYAGMPKIETPCILRLWENVGNQPYDPELEREIKNEAFFQKCTYKRHKGWVNDIIPGSMANHIIDHKE